MGRFHAAALGRGAGIVIVVTLVSAGCASGHPAARKRAVPASVASDTGAGSGPQEQAAVRLAARMVGEAVIPPGSRPYHGRMPAVLHAPLEFPGTKQVVQAHAIWIVRAGLRDVAGFFKTNTPRGFTGLGTGGETLQGVPSYTVSDPLDVLPPNVANAELDVSVANGGNNLVVIRADAVVAWTPPRPAGDFVPPRDRVVTLTVLHPYAKGSPPGKRVVTSDPKLVEPIVRSFNQLRVRAPQPFYECGSLTAHSVSYRVAFSTSPTAAPDVVAGTSQCGSGATFPKAEDLTGDSSFGDALAHLLGLPEPHFG
jgi:hypothetical protein